MTALSALSPAVPAVINIDVDPVLHLGGLAIHWYGVCYAVAFYVGLRYGVIPYLGRHGISRAEAERITFWAIIVGLVSARLYYVVQSSPPQGGSWFSHPEEILAVWHGGMAFFGAVFGVYIYVGIMTWRKRMNFWLIADAGALFAVLGQPIGRIGNVINGDILGYQSNLPWATSYSNPNAILQNGFVNCFQFVQAKIPCVDTTGKPYAYQPAAVYEMLGTLLIGAVLYLLVRRGARVGSLVLTYLGLYALSQVVVFFWRGSEPVVALGLKQGQWTAIVVGGVILPLLFVAWRRGLLNWDQGTPVAIPAGAGEEEALASGAGEGAPAGSPEIEAEAPAAAAGAARSGRRRRRPAREAPIDEAEGATAVEAPDLDTPAPAADPADFERGAVPAAEGAEMAPVAGGAGAEPLDGEPVDAEPVDTGAVITAGGAGAPPSRSRRRRGSGRPRVAP